jgi:CTP-dependent riboflavin kinase
MTPEEETRFSRIEIKLDALAAALVNLARAEERVLQLHESNQIIYKKISSFDDRLRVVEKAQSEAQHIVNNISRFFWLAISSIISIGLGVLWYGGIKK